MAKGFDPNALFTQARKMKEDMGRVQDDLKNRMVEGQAPEGLVTVVANGLQEVEAVRIKPAAVDPDDLEELEDLILVAVRAALEKAKALHEEEMSKITGGMDLPGLSHGLDWEYKPCFGTAFCLAESHWQGVCDG